jgi:ribulose-5-phosphate 4-epimerase/fuculose-1-phosphate aldolase
MNHGLLTVGNTVDEAGFMFRLLDRGFQIQLQVEAACAENPGLTKKLISDEEAAYNFKMASDPDSFYAEMQPDLDYIFEMDGWETVSRGVECMAIG